MVLWEGEHGNQLINPRPEVFWNTPITSHFIEVFVGCEMGSNNSKPETAKQAPTKMSVDDMKNALSAALNGSGNTKGVAGKLNLAMSVLNELKAHVDKTVSPALKEKMNKSNERMFDMLRSISEYIHEFSSDYKTLQKLTKRWDPSDVEAETLSYFFKSSLPNGSLMSRMLDKSSKFAKGFSDLITDVLEINEEVKNSQLSRRTSDLWMVGVGVACVVLGVMALACPAMITLEAPLLAAFLSGGTAAIGFGAAGIWAGMRADEIIQQTKADLLQMHDFMTDLLQKMGPSLTDHKQALEVLDKLKNNGGFVNIGDVDEVCDTFDELEQVFLVATGQKMKKTCSGNTIRAAAVGTAVATATVLATIGCAPELQELEV
eukprot:gene12931-14922_t